MRPAAEAHAPGRCPRHLAGRIELVGVLAEMGGVLVGRDEVQRHDLTGLDGAAGRERDVLDGLALSRMRPDAILINAARGGVVDEAAVAAALKAKKLGGAALDVFVEEPLKAGGVFVDVPNLILTPHIAGVTVESNTRVSWVTVENVKKVLSA